MLLQVGRSFVILILLVPGQLLAADPIGLLFKQQVFDDEAESVSQRAKALPAAERVNHLADWVFQDGIRFSGYVDSTLEAPVLLLLKTARETERLDELSQRAQKLQRSISAASYGHPATKNRRLRSVAAFLALIELERERPAAARPHLQTLYDLASEKGMSSQLQYRWPELIVVSKFIQKAQFRSVAFDLLGTLDLTQADTSSELVRAFQNGIRRAQNATEEHESVTVFHSTQNQAVQSEASATQQDIWSLASSPGTAFASRWHLKDGEYRPVVVSPVDRLFLRSPLTGDYEVECEVSTLPQQRGHLLVGATGFLTGLKNSLQLQRPLKSAGTRPIDPPLYKFAEWSRYRIVAGEGLRRYFLNGRLLAELQFDDNPDPWFAIRSLARNAGAIRSLSLSGSPSVPESVRMIGADHRYSWHETMPWASQLNGLWNSKSDEQSNMITGKRVSALSGCEAVSHLHYHRPFFEDGVIDYEFFYQDGVSEVSPLLDSVAFVLKPDGVEIRDTSDRAESQFVETSVPLTEGEWNKVNFSIQGNELTITLNDTPIVTHRLAADAQRYFGFSYDPGATGARVRNCIWHGKWPRELPTLEGQTLAVTQHPCLDGIDQLKEIQNYKGGSLFGGASDFQLGGGKGGSVSGAPGGFRFEPSVGEGWKSLRATKQTPIFGDFDAILTFADLKLTRPSRSSVSAEINVVETGTELLVGCSRTVDPHGRQSASAKLAVPLDNGKKKHSSQRINDESSAGRLRIVRRGSTVHSLIAHEDSPNFHYVGSQSFRSATSPATLQFQANSSGGGAVSVVMKELTIRSNSEAVRSRRDPRVDALNSYTLALVDRVDLGMSELAMQPTVIGDADVTAAVDVSSLIDGRATMSLLRPDASQLTVSVTQTKDQTFQVRFGEEAEVGERYGETTVDQVRDIRFVRIQRTLFALVTDDERTHLLGAADVDDAPIEKNHLQLKVQAGQSPASVIWRALQIRASELDRS